MGCWYHSTSGEEVSTIFKINIYSKVRTTHENWKHTQISTTTSVIDIIRKGFVSQLHWGIIYKWELYVFYQAGLRFLTKPTDNSHNSGNSACRFKKRWHNHTASVTIATKRLPVCNAWVITRPYTKWWGTALYIDSVCVMF